MLLYRILNSSPTTFNHIIDIVLGDFNTDILNNTNISLQDVLSNYTLLVNEAIQPSGSLIDDIFVNNETLQNFSIGKTEIVGIYFSDYDVVKFRLQNKYSLSTTKLKHVYQVYI